MEAQSSVWLVLHVIIIIIIIIMYSVHLQYC